MIYNILKPVRAVAISFTLFSTPLIAMAQNGITVDEPIRARSNIYEPVYFERYAPRTALDMIARIPGFQINSSDDRRGLGQGGANVLINGERLTGKSDPFDQLGRITAGNVVKIEIVDGASLDIPGLSGQVANITTQTDGISGTWEWRPQWRQNLEANFANYEVALSGETGNLAYSLELRDSSFRSGARGPEILTNSLGIVFETREEDGRNNGDRPGASINLTYKPKADHIANVNAEFNLFNFNGREISRRTAITEAGQNREAIFTNSEDEWNTEISGDYQFPFLNGKLKVIGLYQFEHSPTVGQFEIFEAGQSIDNSRFLQSSDETESIIRTEYSWSASEGRDWQIGLEGAFNVLDIENQFVERDNNGDFIGDDPEQSEVSEDRAELTITHSRALSSKWDLQASLGGEYSKLTQVSAASSVVNEREFFRPKGFLAATYKVDDSFSVRSRIEREVGQLNFFDFISTVNLTDNLDQAGNPDLVPQQSWAGELEFDKDFGQGNTFKARFYGSLISDIVDRIPVGINGDAVGNIDKASQYGVDFTATLKGEKWGIDGTELNLQLEFRDSSVDDPVQGFARRLNRDKITYYSVDFRHDIPNTDWAYGLFFDRFIEAEVFRLTTRQQFTFTKPFTIIFLEHKNIAGLKVRASLLNLLDSGERFERSFFDARRDLGRLERIESRERKFKPFFRLNISGTF